MDAALVNLHTGLAKRARPEDVAATIEELISDQIDADTRHTLQLVASHATRFGTQRSSMSDDFEAPHGADKQIRTVLLLINPAGVVAEDPPEPTNVAGLRKWALDIGEQIGWSGFMDKHVRTNGRARRRLWRALTHLSEKTDRIEAAHRLRHATLTGRSGYATQIPYEDFADDTLTAATVAYITARRNVRRGFTLNGKHGTTDELSNKLRRSLDSHHSTRWDVLAAVQPSPTVLSHLDDEDRAALVGLWGQEMRNAAAWLNQLAAASDTGLGDRIGVTKGDNSTSWNIAATWFNTARANWFACLRGTGLTAVLDHYCPPKVLRVMAGDLLRWHTREGTQPHPDVQIAQALPHAWDVCANTSRCTLADIDHAMTATGNPHATGWKMIPGPRDPEPSRPTDELVHGIAVTDPLVAALLRTEGIWSGNRNTHHNPTILALANEHRISS